MLQGRPATSNGLHGIVRAALCAGFIWLLAGLSPRIAVGAMAQDQPPQVAEMPQIAGVDARAVLSASGSFVQHPKYGEVWVPSATPPGWHPYPPCHWVDSRAYGWYFDDPTPWGGIVHHYGRWTHDDQMGWIWVPGAEFSPGWVVWRNGPAWIGWAPMPPQADIQTISADTFDNGGFWIFMETAKFARGCGDGVVAPAQQFPLLLQQTQFVTDIAYVEGIVVFVLPQSIVGGIVDVHVSFHPWPAWFVVQLVANWNWVWTHLTVVINVVNNCPPK